MALAAVFLATNELAAGHNAAAPQKTYVFRGKIQDVNSAKRTFTLQTETKSYVFTVTPETKVLQGREVRGSSALWLGLTAEVTMKIGAAGEGIALTVRLVSKGEALLDSVLAATTPSGKTLSADQLKPLILHQEWAPGLAAPYSKLKLGVFLLDVRGDGTVAQVEILQSTQEPILDRDIVRAFMKWQFRPNSVKEVRVPAYYVWTRW